MLVLIDGRPMAISDSLHADALSQLELSSDFVLVEATAVLQHETGNGTVEIPLPFGLVVAAFVNRSGLRRYGVVSI